MTPTTNLSLKKIDGNENWREIFDDHNDSMDLIDAAVKSNSDEISTTEKSLIYVVDGNKCANAVPVGSYVQLINSTISGRSDGCYTVKTAIPANTAINNTYFNETAPIAGGAVNSLNSNIANNLSFLKVSGTLGAVNATVNIYTHSTSLTGYMIAGWSVILDGAKYIWQGVPVIENLFIDNNTIRCKNLSADIVGKTIEILLYKVPT